MIQNPSKDLTLIVYNSPKPPRYISLNKALIKMFIFIVPVLIFATITITFSYSFYLKNQINTLKSKEPLLIQSYKDTETALRQENSELSKTNDILTKKLTVTDSSSKSHLNGLTLITPPVGLEDKRLQELLKIEDIKVESRNKVIYLNFNLSNNSQQKLSGFITVTKYQGSNIQYFPKNALSLKNLRIDFTQGESFSFSRLRPTEVTFNKISKKSAHFKIYIFSRTGDLLALKQIGPYNIE